MKYYVVLGGGAAMVVAPPPVEPKVLVAAHLVRDLLGHGEVGVVAGQTQLLVRWERLLRLGLLLRSQSRHPGVKAGVDGAAETCGGGAHVQGVARQEGDGDTQFPRLPVEGGERRADGVVLRALGDLLVDGEVEGDGDGVGHDGGAFLVYFTDPRG